MNTRKYFFFTRSKRTFELANKYIKLMYVWDDARGAGWTATVQLSQTELRTLKVKLWNCKYQLLKVR